MVNKLKLTKEKISISLILILSAILNFVNIGIEGYGNSYYAAGVKSMTMNLKNFFFVSFDPASFVTIDKPPVGFWIQAIFAKIFGFSGWSILLPQAIAGVVSVYLIYYLVKRSFGILAGLISALCLTITPVFVAASRNNTIDNLLVVTLLFACVALTKAAEKGKVKYLCISLLLVGIGFNIKMLEAYMIGPAIYITYLLSSKVSLKKRIGHLAICTVVLAVVSFSWTIVVDLIPVQNRPYVGSSTNNSELELIIGHNGLERLGLSGKSNKGFGGSFNKDDGNRSDSNNNKDMTKEAPAGNNQENMHGANVNGENSKTSVMSDGRNNKGNQNGQGMPGTTPSGSMQPPEGGMQGGGPGGQGSFGSQVKAGITRLFAKSSLSDQIIWFLPLALFGFIAGAIKEKLGLKLDNKRKISLVLWITWLVPEFIYFSYTTGLFHPYYLTMMAPPAAALAGIGIVSMWEFYKEGGWKAWLLPLGLIITGITHMMMLSYYTNNLSTIIKTIILIALILCFISSVILIILTFVKKQDNSNVVNNKKTNLKQVLAGIATISIMVTPFIGSSAAIIHSVNSSIPCAGLELLSTSEKMLNGMPFAFGGGNNVSSSKLLDFLKNNKTTEKYLLVVSSSQSADNIIIQSGESVMALGGFSGSDNILTLDEFKEMVKEGEVRYVLSGGRGPGGSNEIMNWVTENGKVVPESEYKDTTTNNEIENTGRNDLKNNTSNSSRQNFGGNSSEQLYDLKDLADN